MDYLLGVDVGSSSVKSALFDTQGHMAALSIQEYELNQALVDHDC